MEPNPYDAPKEAGCDQPAAIEHNPKGWSEVVLWAVALFVTTIVVAGLLAVRFFQTASPLP